MKDPKYKLILEIVKRSEAMEIGVGDRISRMMDIEFANDIFNLKLKDFLNADNFDFVHDFCGIQQRINRSEKKWVDECFLPRFATR